LLANKVGQRDIGDHIENNHVDIVLQLALNHVALASDAGIVNEVLNLKILLVYFIKDLLSAVHLAQVGGNGVDLDTEILDKLLLSLVQPVLMVADEHQVPILLGVVTS